MAQCYGNGGARLKVVDRHQQGNLSCYTPAKDSKIYVLHGSKERGGDEASGRPEDVDCWHR